MKRLIICLDGTWNTPDQPGKITNVVKIMRAIRPHDDHGIEQIVYYDKGVGTANFNDMITGGMLGRGLDDNIKDGYRFLANNYLPGDEISLHRHCERSAAIQAPYPSLRAKRGNPKKLRFGFSRSATAHSLSGIM